MPQTTFQKIMNTLHIHKVKSWVISHKVWTGIIVIGVIFGGYSLFKGHGSAEVRYVEADVIKGTVVSSITASGQVEASSQIDLKARATEQITYVGVKAGDTVRQGRTLFSLNSKDAQKAVRNAETNLQTAQLELDKFKQAPDSVDVLTIKQAIKDAESSKTDAQDAIADAYDTVLNSSIAAVSADINNTSTAPTISGTYLKGKDVEIRLTMYQAGASGGYFTVASTPAGLVTGTGDISTVIPQPIGDSGLFIKFPNTNVSTGTGWVITLPNKSASNYATNMVAYQKAIENKKRIDNSADLTIAQNNKKLNDLYQPDALDLRAKEIAVQQAQDALNNAKEDLSDYYVTAPFDGTISNIVGKVGDTASGTLATIITGQKIASVSLNEVDVAKIAVGQKATLTFDAIEDLSIAGTVASIDSVGTVTQGVVNYTVKIAFATQDDRVKPGMTVSASIINSVVQDVLTVPNSAVKTKNGISYVEVFDDPLPEALAGTVGSISEIPPRQQEVEIGLSNDTVTEIKSGLIEGDKVVSRTITSTAGSTTAQAPSLLGGSNTRAAGGAIRATNGR